MAHEIPVLTARIIGTRFSIARNRAASRCIRRIPSEVPNQPSSLNAITVTRYRVTFKRADGRNNPGVDVPYAFDGAATATVGGTTTVSLGFDLVRHQMKEEPPLRNLVNSGGANLISAIADITFYGRDQAGNDVEVTGSMTVNFGDFGDPR